VGKVKVDCNNPKCGNVMELYQSETKKIKYCSRECRVVMTTGENNGKYKPPVEKICLNCGRIFSVPKCKEVSAKYCSVDCRCKASRVYNQEKCAICGKVYTPYFKGQKTCSNACGVENQKRTTTKPFGDKARVCFWCGKKYVSLARKKSQKYCSKACGRLNTVNTRRMKWVLMGITPENLVELHINQKFSKPQIAQKYNISVGKMQEIFKIYGVTPENYPEIEQVVKGNKGKGRESWSAESLKQQSERMARINKDRWSCSATRERISKNISIGCSKFWAGNKMPEYQKRIRSTIGRMIHRDLKARKGGNSWEEILGYTVYELMAHLESMFTDGMTWENYGKWHVDHIMPVSSFRYKDYTDDQFQKCWALGNLQPLWAEDNLRKGAKLPHELEVATNG